MRLAETRPGELIDRSRQIEFSFDGKHYPAYHGDTVGTALAAAGVRTISRSFKYHRPRGLLCCAGHCPNCLVQIADEPNVRACQRPVTPGLEVRSQNAWPTLDRDLMSLAQMGSRFMPVGFYYKTFMRPAVLWPSYERVLRRAAGLGVVDPHAPAVAGDKQYLHGDVVVVGGGPAGLSAARAAAADGARVLLFDDNPQLGGHLRHSRGGVAAHDAVANAAVELDRLDNVEIYLNTPVLGCYQDNWLAAACGSRLYKIRAGAIVCATGTIETPAVFSNNDLPGIFLSGAVRRLMHLYGVAPGRSAVVVTADDDGWRLATELQYAGVEIAALADEREQGADAEYSQALRATGVPVHLGHGIVGALGRGKVAAALLERTTAEAAVASQTLHVNCDAIVLSGTQVPAADLLFAAGARGVFDDQAGLFRFEHVPAGLFSAGRLCGTRLLEDEAAEGGLAGRAAAAYARGEQLENAITEPRPGSPDVVSSGAPLHLAGKSFVCLCEDVTREDIGNAIAEGYDSVELLKRYTTVAMGPCQGKMCSLNSLKTCAHELGCSVAEVGKTTSRPPTTPVTLSALAGQQMEPVQVSPLHDWHVARGARMMVAGLWLRPEHYGEPTAEVSAVRERVGLIDVSPLGKLRLTGAGVPALLEKIYVNQWHNLRRGRVRYGIMCNDEGVVLDDGVCARSGDKEWYMSTTSTGASGTVEWIEWWRQSGWGDGVHVTDLTETHAAFNLAGPQARSVLQKLTERDLSDGKFPYMRVRSADVCGVPCLLLRIGFTGELSYEVHCPAGYGQHIWEALLAAGEEFDIAPFGVEAQRVLRLEKAHIIVGQDTDALSDPISAASAWAVKLDKPDFLGRRALVRIAQQGPKSRLVGFTMAHADQLPAEGMQIVTGPSEQRKMIGWVTSSRLSPTLDKAIGLCWLPAGIASRDAAMFYVDIDGEFAEARVHHGPFYDPDGHRLKG